MQVNLPITSPSDFATTTIMNMPVELEKEQAKYEEKIKPVFDKWEDLLKMGINFDNQDQFMREIIGALVFMDERRKSK